MSVYPKVSKARQKYFELVKQGADVLDKSPRAHNVYDDTDKMILARLWVFMQYYRHKVWQHTDENKIDELVEHARECRYSPLSTREEVARVVQTTLESLLEGEPADTIRVMDFMITLYLLLHPCRESAVPEE
jgi:hypothetical protein